ncbi:GAF domain-containing protein [Halosimplex sp. TS25]|uniref:hybrid sensor histidine kinase/response regulator n=1 Tax=Halosimplex rarum TaxID=3396619 RepID=UPI0039EA6A9E
MSAAATDDIRVLHVDDDPDVADLTATFLEREDDRFVVDTASDATEGLDRLTSGAFDCVVSDYDMPGRNGIEFLEAVRADHPELPFVLFTGKGSEAVASDAISAGVTDYLQKEGGTDQYTVLANRVANAVEHYRTRRFAERSENRLREIVDSLPELLYVIDEDGTCLLANESLARFYGTSVSALEGAKVGDFLDDDVAEGLRTATLEVIESNAPERFHEVELRNETGETRVFEPQLLPYDFADTDTEAVLGISVDVTERQERERELERTNALLSTLFDTLPVGVLAEDGSRNVLTANAQLFDLFDLSETPADVVGSDSERLAETIGESFADPEGFVDRVGELVANRERVRDEPLSLRDGRTVSRSYRPIELADGDGHLWVYRDVTAQKTRERKLNRLQERTRALMHTRTKTETARVATDAADEVIDARLSSVHLVDDDGDHLTPVAVVDSVRDVFDEIPTYPRDAPEGTRAALVWDVFESGEPLRIDDVPGHDSLTEDTPARSVILYPMDDHGVFIVSSDEPGAITETDETLVEILSTTLTTALDRVEQAGRRREREQRLERLQDVTLDLMQTEGRQSIADLVVEEAEDILGFPLVMVRTYDADEGGLVPVASSDLVDEVFDGRPTFTSEGESFNWEAFETGESRAFDDISKHEEAVDADTPLQSLLIFPMGEFGTLSAGSTEPATFDETDVFLGRILATAANAAFERADHEAELRHQRDELERKNERLEEFTSVVSHDLRNPLTVLNGALEMAEDTGEREHFERCRRSVRRMEDLIEDLLTLSRQGETIAEPEPVDLGRIATESWANVESGDGELAIETDGAIVADGDRFPQLLENLFRNALEHGGDDVRITVGDLDDGFYVADDGPGISGDVRDRVFESGFSTSPENTGFGLAIVERIVEAHGWDVAVTESESGGARFEITGVESATRARSDD